LFDGIRRRLFLGNELKLCIKSYFPLKSKKCELRLITVKIMYIDIAQKYQYDRTIAVNSLIKVGVL